MSPTAFRSVSVVRYGNTEGKSLSRGVSRASNTVASKVVSHNGRRMALANTPHRKCATVQGSNVETLVSHGVKTCHRAPAEIPLEVGNQLGRCGKLRWQDRRCNHSRRNVSRLEVTMPVTRGALLALIQCAESRWDEYSELRDILEGAEGGQTRVGIPAKGGKPAKAKKPKKS